MNYAKSEWIWDALTFPGVVVRQTVKFGLCRMMRLAVLESCYFQFENPCGFVRPEPAASVVADIVFVVVPFVVCSLLGSCLALPAVIPVVSYGETLPPYLVVIWLGISVASHAFPDGEDAKRLWKSTRASSAAARFVATPFALFTSLGAVGRIAWVDFAFGAAVVVWVPMVIMEYMLKVH